MLDTMIASDEGLREYLWSPQSGMKYALGSLASDRFGRYIITILFDMFFTVRVNDDAPKPCPNLQFPKTPHPDPHPDQVILFKHGYSTLVQTAGFSKNGREWIANAVVSSACGILTFVVCDRPPFESAPPPTPADGLISYALASRRCQTPT